MASEMIRYINPQQALYDIAQIKAGLINFLRSAALRSGDSRIESEGIAETITVEFEDGQIVRPSAVSVESGKLEIESYDIVDPGDEIEPGQGADGDLLTLDEDDLMSLSVETVCEIVKHFT